MSKTESLIKCKLGMLQMPTCMATYECAYAQSRQSDQVSGRSDSMQQQMGKATFDTTIKSTDAAATDQEISHMLL
jgi:hypothetical protein